MKLNSTYTHTHTHTHTHKHTHTHTHTHMDGPAEPTANRGVMHAVVNVSSAEYSGLVNFFVTHFGLNDRDQCRSV